jgi:hypothetical protein
VYTIIVTNNRDLEIKTNRFDQMCSTITNNKTRKDTQILFYKAMAVPILTYGSEIYIYIYIYTTRKRKQEARTESAEIKFLRNVTGYTIKGKIKKNA